MSLHSSCLLLPAVQSLSTWTGCGVSLRVLMPSGFPIHLCMWQVHLPAKYYLQGLKSVQSSRMLDTIPPQKETFMHSSSFDPSSCSPPQESNPGKPPVAMCNFY